MFKFFKSFLIFLHKQFLLCIVECCIFMIILSMLDYPLYIILTSHLSFLNISNPGLKIKLRLFKTF